MSVVGEQHRYLAGREAEYQRSYVIWTDEFVFNASLREVINASSLREVCLAHVRWTAYAAVTVFPGEHMVDTGAGSVP